MPEKRNKFGVPIERFDGGLNRKSDPIQVPLNQALVLNRFLLDDHGSITRYLGSNTLNSTSPNTQAYTQSLVSYKPSTMSALLVSVIGDSAYVITGTATAMNVIPASVGCFTSDGTSFAESTVFQELLFFSHKTVQPYKFNGNEFTRAGVSAPTQALSAFSNAGAGNLTGSYTYVYWGVNSYAAEGDYGGTSPSIAVTTAQVRVTNIPTAPVSHGINTWKIARNTANGAGLYWYLTDIANGTTSFTDNVADSSLTELAPTDQGYLRKFHILFHYANRLWGVADDFLWYSNINQPEEFPSENFVRVGRGDGLDISAAVPFMGMIVISKSDYNGKTAVYTLNIGDSATFADPESWYLKLVSNYGGSESQRACVAYSNYLMMFNRTGAYAFNGSTLVLRPSETSEGTIVSHKVSELINTSDHDIDPALTKYTAAIDWENRVWLATRESNSWTPTTNLPPNADMLVLDYSTLNNADRVGGAWSRLPNPEGFVCQFAIHEGEAYYGGKQGYVFKLTGTGHENTFSTYTSPMIRGLEGHEGHTKDFRWIFITARGTGTMNVSVGTDSISGTTNFRTVQGVSVTLSSTGTVHKIALNSTGALGGISGRWINVIISNTSSIGGSMTISKIEAFYTLRGLRNG